MVLQGMYIVTITARARSHGEKTQDKAKMPLGTLSHLQVTKGKKKLKK